MVAAEAMTGPESGADQTRLAMLPGAAPPAPAVVPGAVPPSGVVRLARVSGEVFCGTDAVTVASELGKRTVVRTGKNAWCEIQFDDVIVRCWQNSECGVDAAHRLIHVKSGSVIVRKKAIEADLVVIAAGKSLLLENGVLRVEVSGTTVRAEQ